MTRGSDALRWGRMSSSEAIDRSVRFSDPQVNLYVGDIQRSLAFYRDTLGFTETFRVPKAGAPSHVELVLGSLTLGVATFAAAEQHHHLRTGSGPPRLEIVLFTRDVDGAYGWATARGAPTVRAPHDFLGYLHNARVADPDGNPVVFTTRLPVMTTPDPTVRPTFRNHLINLYTEKIDPALDFYRGMLGFAETFRNPKEGPPDHVEMELGPLNLSVSTVEALRRHHGLSGGGGSPRGEVVVSVADADAAYAWTTSRGARSLAPAHDFAGTLRASWIADPDGNPVQLVARRSSGGQPPPPRSGA
jgi:glyoxylase I family protein